MGNIAASRVAGTTLSHNLVGQRLGRKGRGTRERILEAANRLLADASNPPISLSAVAREASLAMTTLYLYFSDLTELILAVLGPIMAMAEDTYVAQLREYWPDEALGDRSLAFVEAYHAFWERHTRVLHLRNSMADAGDARMREQRIGSAQPVIQLLALQIPGELAPPRPPRSVMATVLMMGAERLVTIATDAEFPGLSAEKSMAHVRNLLKAEARLLEVGLRDCREACAG